MVSIEYLKANFTYDPLTGVVYRKSGPQSGSVASVLLKRQGKNRVSIKGKKMYAYRIAWALHYGVWPTYEIDHINGNSADDRISNLRDVTRKINQENVRRPNSRNSLGILGVSKKGNFFTAKLVINRRLTQIGTYKTADEAYEAYVNEKRKHHAGCTL